MTRPSRRSRLHAARLRRRFGPRLVLPADVHLLGPSPVVRLPGTGRLEVGARTVLMADPQRNSLGAPCRVQLITGLEGRITLGEDCQLASATISSYAAVTLGDRCQVGQLCLITDTDFHPTAVAPRRAHLLGEPFDRDTVAKEPVVLEDDVWVGWGAIVLKGVRIGAGSIVGAGAVVTRDVPAGVVAAGNPARVVREL